MLAELDFQPAGKDQVEFLAAVCRQRNGCVLHGFVVFCGDDKRLALAVFEQRRNMAVFKPLFTLYGHSVAGAGQLVKIQLRIGAGNQLGNIHPQPLRAFVKVRKVEILSAAFERFVFGGRDPAYGSHFGNRNFQVFPRPFQPLCDKLCLFHVCVPPAGKNKKGFIRNEMKPEKTSFIPLICRRVHADPTLLRRELRPCLKNSAGQLEGDKIGGRPLPRNERQLSESR